MFNKLTAAMSESNNAIALGVVVIRRSESLLCREIVQKSGSRKRQGAECRSGFDLLEAFSREFVTGEALLRVAEHTVIWRQVCPAVME